ncbi:ATP-dependent Clp protease ATP-binding subunit ClpA [Streptomyces aurantiacus]|uniref:Clp protease N-terminal domain-containing protein n=1 Tax=Streptomyces aurantiacus TaxID=47760 RepID=UPI0027931B34|nr:Clp protease N-terminal domain-containing protein [Streptomyces aurantiacus]MDQ0774559.1 ATP-dependent Clp protease ATP-binding subunit ClpA [Streptomyces aurantiacus]
MFERFTKHARAVVLGAVGHAERLDAEAVEEQHMLLALLDREASRASFALTSLGLGGRRESVGRALAEARRRGGLSRADTDALSGLGIDVSAIVSRVEEAHGEGALAAVQGKGKARGGGKDGGKDGGLGRDRERGRGWWSGFVGGRRPFSPGAKQLLTESLRIALAQQDRHVGDEHLLLALAARPGVPAEVLADHGVTYASLRRVLYGGGEAKAG